MKSMSGLSIAPRLHSYTPLTKIVTGLTKAQIRSKIILRLKAQKEDIRDRKSRKIQEKLFRQKEFIKAKIVMFYIALCGEVNTEGMIKQTKNLGKIIAVPVCKKNRITLRPCLLDGSARLKKGPYGAREPSAKQTVRAEDIDLVIVPGLAFDKKGNRLGRGKGCYDSFLKKVPKDTPSIGLAFDFQILPQIPTTTSDVSVDKVIFA
jgi:5-formyltetrahydrofolate cyclo-ligase